MLYAILALLIALTPNAGIENTLTVQKANTFFNVEAGDSYSRCFYGISVGNGYHVMPSLCGTMWYTREGDTWVIKSK